MCFKTFTHPFGPSWRNLLSTEIVLLLSDSFIYLKFGFKTTLSEFFGFTLGFSFSVAEAIGLLVGLLTSISVMVYLFYMLAFSLISLAFFVDSSFKSNFISLNCFKATSSKIYVNDRLGSFGYGVDGSCVKCLTTLSSLLWTLYSALLGCFWFSSLKWSTAFVRDFKLCSLLAKSLLLLFSLSFLISRFSLLKGSFDKYPRLYICKL